MVQQSYKFPHRSTTSNNNDNHDLLCFKQNNNNNKTFPTAGTNGYYQQTKQQARHQEPRYLGKWIFKVVVIFAAVSLLLTQQITFWTIHHKFPKMTTKDSQKYYLPPPLPHGSSSSTTSKNSNELTNNKKSLSNPFADLQSNVQKLTDESLQALKNSVIGRDTLYDPLASSSSILKRLQEHSESKLSLALIKKEKRRLRTRGRRVKSTKEKKDDTVARQVSPSTNLNKDFNNTNHARKNNLLGAVRGSSSSSSTLMVNKDKRVHLCYSELHSVIGSKILLEELNFTSVRLSSKDVRNNNWDLIYGGYPHCGRFHHHRKTNTWDWDMKSGLNKMLLEQNAFYNLQPHQVYQPCMGCSKSYCNKYELCKIVRDAVDPSACHILPEDYEQLKNEMIQNPDKAWVLKQDAADIHLHTGRGVEYITSVDQLPTPKEQQQGIWLVQPFNVPYLGQGIFRRKSEVRVYIAITNVYPIRAYIYKRGYVVIAAKEFTDSDNEDNNNNKDTKMNITEIVSDVCRLDTHSLTRKCNDKMPEDFVQTLDKIGSPGMRQLTFEDYAEHAGMSIEYRDQLMSDIEELLAKVVYHGHTAFENHSINQGIFQSNARCFSHMRADIGITQDGKPFLFEISEFPGMRNLNSKLVHDVVKDVFSMIGLDKNKNETIPIDEREAYELSHLGSYKPLKPPKNYYNDNRKEIQ